MNNFGEWRKVTDEEPPCGVMVICAFLHEFTNARWKYSVYINTRYKDDYWEKLLPDYWMPLPSPPPLTKKQKEESERCYKSDKLQRIKTLEAELKKLQK